MNFNQNVFSVGNFDFRLNHILIIVILSLSFSTSFLIRMQPAQFGWELNEFDPFFNYRATQYIVNNGIDSYFQWNDELSWHPDGRNVSHTSQVMLHITTAITYWIFGGNGNLYDFSILFPVIVGSLTAIVVFALVRTIGGTTAGLFASLLFSVSLPIIVRGQVGWFKSEPLGLFFGVLGLYLLTSGLNTKNKKFVIGKLLASSIFTIFGLSSWGGNQFFIIVIGIFFLLLPLIRTDKKFLLWTIPLFSVSAIIFSFGFERLSFNLAFIKGLGGLSLIFPTLFVIACIFIQKKSNKNNERRNGVLFLALLLIIVTSIVIINFDSQFLPLPSHRYLNAINPLLTTSDPLVDSVSEHATTTLAQSFFFHSILMIFSGLGIWLILKNHKKFNFVKNDMILFSLIFGLIGVYISSTFVRLEVFASLGLIILSSLSLSILLKEILYDKIEINKTKQFISKSSFVTGLIILLIIPLVFPVGQNTISASNNPLTIMNGGTQFSISSNDWNDSLNWIKDNTPKDSVVGSWWDYGYWIQTKGERSSLADNSTLDTSVIQKIAKTLLSSPEQGWRLLNEMESDYFVIFVSGQRLTTDHENQPLYSLHGGGDESKKQWFMRIAGEPLTQYLHSDGISGTDYFWNETLLGNMIPFTPLVYANFQTNEQSLTYQPGFTPVYVKEIKYFNDDGPLKLVYSSPSFDAEKGEQMIGVFIYEINKNYVPNN